jgi:hypothetical protein
VVRRAIQLCAPALRPRVLPTLLSPDVKGKRSWWCLCCRNLELDVQNLRYWWSRLGDVDAVDFLHYFTEPGVERRM